MGTRADFYVGKGPEAEWLGSIAWDGYPSGIAKTVFTSKTEKTYRKRVEAFFRDDRTDVSRPADGWPWPWEDSATTDFAYTFHKGKVYVSCFGNRYLPFKTFERVNLSETLGAKWEKEKKEDFPNMEDKQKTTFGKRSGLTVVDQNGPIDNLL